jgi:hypothetical protein
MDSRTVARAYGVSLRTIEHAQRVLRHGTPALVAAVSAGRLPVSVASKAVDLSPSEQDALADAVVRAPDATAGRKAARAFMEKWAPAKMRATAGLVALWQARLHRLAAAVDALDAGNVGADGAVSEAARDVVRAMRAFEAANG